MQPHMTSPQSHVIISRNVVLRMTLVIRKLTVFLSGLFFAASTAFASNTGVTLTLPLVVKDPGGLHGYRASVWYQPESLVWQRVHIFFDASFGEWWISGHVPNRQVNIYALAPTLRYYLRNDPYFRPFIDFSLGLSYLSKTRFDTRNLGMHFSFQDIIGIGTTLGKEQRLSISFSAMHYSNGSTCRRNAGITIPLLLNVGYRI